MVSIEHTDPVNARILSVSEDKIAGFVQDPFAEIARKTELPLVTVLERIRDMLEAGTIRRVRQTLLATNLASGALVAWKVPSEKLDAAFDFMFQEDPPAFALLVLRTRHCIHPARHIDHANATGLSSQVWTAFPGHPTKCSGRLRRLREASVRERQNHLSLLSQPSVFPDPQ